MLKYNTTIREIGPPSTQSMAHLGAFLQVFPGKVRFTARDTSAPLFFLLALNYIILAFVSVCITN